MVEDFPLFPWYLLPDLTSSNCRHKQSPFFFKKFNKKMKRWKEGRNGVDGKRQEVDFLS